MKKKIKQKRKVRRKVKKNIANNIADFETKISFIKYLADHPEERLWQSLRNWSGFPFILGSSHWTFEMFNNKFMSKNKVSIYDTFFKDYNKRFRSSDSLETD